MKKNGLKIAPEKGFNLPHLALKSMFAQDLITKITERKKNGTKNLYGHHFVWKGLNFKSLAFIFASSERWTSNENKI